MVLADELGGLEFAIDFINVAADRVVVHVDGDHFLIRVDDVGGPDRKAFIFQISAEGAADFTGWVGAHRIGNFGNSFRMVVPSFVNISGVSRNGDDFGSQFLKISVFFGGIFKFSRTDEGEVGRIEKQDQPFTFVIS